MDAIKDLDDRWITIGVSEKNSFIQITVTDSGKSIPGEVSKRMMDPFFTTKKSGQGTGLGLSISKNLAEKNGGNLYYDETSHNTRFVLLIPAVN